MNFCHLDDEFAVFFLCSEGLYPIVQSEKSQCLLRFLSRSMGEVAVSAPLVRSIGSGVDGRAVAAGHGPLMRSVESPRMARL